MKDEKYVHMEWDEKTHCEKLSHVNLHLIKARGELEDAKGEMGWLTQEGIVHPTYALDFSKIVVDLQERITIDLEDDVLEMIDLENSHFRATAYHRDREEQEKGGKNE